jgi:hypothetical protein
VRGWVNLAPHKSMGRSDILLSLLGLALAAWLAAILFRRKLYRNYPFFFGYVVFSILATIGLLSVGGNYKLFFEVYWTTETLSAVLALLALHEAFRDVFRVDYHDWPWFKLVFPVAVGILAVFFIGDAALHPPAQAPPIVVIVLSLGKVVNFIMGGLFCLFFLLALLLAPRWQRYPFGIVLGFAVSAAGGAAIFAARSVFGTKVNLVAKYGLSVAYILGVLVWIGTCFQRPDPELQPPRTGILEALRTADEYSRFFKWITGRR